MLAFTFCEIKAQIPNNDPSIVARFPMELAGNTITESISGKSFIVQNNFQRPESVTGVDGQAVRMDGYSSVCSAEINTSKLNPNALTFSLWCALETYPVFDPNNNVNTKTYLAGNLDDNQKSGFAFTLNSTGVYAFETWIDGTKIVCCDFNVTLPLYTWNNLIASVNSNTKEINLYRNGQLITSSYFFGKGILNTGNNSFTIGKSFEQVYTGIFRTNTINGLIDEIRVYSKALSASERQFMKPATEPDLRIPKSRHENDIHRPIFHGIPATNWTNEPHGLVFYNDKYHLFFQKNANGPYWGKIQWGHLTSNDLINWNEEKIALSNFSSYDVKGVWSGCVFTDDVLTGGKPNIFYSGADYAKVSINKAQPADEDLIHWDKNTTNPIIPNKPVGLSDDFRDPYLFKSGNDFYMIVGTSKDGKGATTLHKYDLVNKTWSNDGKIFYQSSNVNYGTFWEMPVIVPMNDGKWLFLVTILGGSYGVETLYWVGSINSDGTFNPYDSIPKEVELGAMSTFGYGLLSPSILQKDGKTIAIGIVPDKLPAENNLALGWAHLYSLPREWKLDENNELVQIPYSGINAIRVLNSNYNASGLDINSTSQLLPVSGKAVEIDCEFNVSDASKIGFNVRKSGGNFISIYYSPASNKITVDARNAARLINDAGIYDGLYESIIPQNISYGATMRIHIFIDHSIMDIFLNNKYAFSIRIFPTDSEASDIDVFSEGGSTHFGKLQIWKLDPSLSATSIKLPISKNKIIIYSNRNEIIYDKVPIDSTINIYNLTGFLVFLGKNKEESGKISLQKDQMYIVKIYGKSDFSTKLVL